MHFVQQTGYSYQQKRACVQKGSHADEQCKDDSEENQPKPEDIRKVAMTMVDQRSKLSSRVHEVQSNPKKVFKTPIRRLAKVAEADGPALRQ